MKKLSYLTILAITLCTVNAFSQQSKRIYKDPSHPIEKRVNDLISRMTLDEKIAQLGARTGETKSEIMYGMVFGFFRGVPAANAAKKYNAFQKKYIENTRLGIPVLFVEEGIFGMPGYKNSSFPHSIALASSWNIDLMETMVSAISKEVKARGHRMIFSPVVNLGRDVRWGRIHETYGEDPYLSAKMGVAFVKTAEGAGVITTPKHFVANVGMDGKFGSPVHFSERLLREQYFPAFKESFQEGGAKSVMAAYNTLDGIPCNANKWLLTDVLKKEWGFDGFVVSDGHAIKHIYDAFRTAETKPEAASLSFNAGIDVEIPVDFFNEPLKEAVKLGLVKESDIDESVKRVLTQKFRLGLFESPYVDPKIAEKIVNNEAQRKVALEVAKEGIILLKNDNKTLPFSKDIKSIAVLGPLGDELLKDHYTSYGVNFITVLDGIKNLLPNVKVNFEKGAELDNYMNPAIHSNRFSTVFNGKTVEGLKGEYFDNTKFSGNPVFTRVDKVIEFDWEEGSPRKDIPNDNYAIRWSGKLKSPVDGSYKITGNADDGLRVYLDGKLVIDQWSGGARRLIESDEISFEKDKVYDIKIEYLEQKYGSYVSVGWTIDPYINIPKAVEFAKKSDVAVVVVGSLSAENADRAILNLNSAQEKLIQEVAKTGKPLAVILQTGNVITMQNWIDGVPAVLEAWYPGEQGGNAIAEVLFGDVNPSGKLPVTIPKVIGQVPLNYNHLPFKPGNAYIGTGNDPMFPFGFGLSYTTFEYGKLKLSSSKINKDEDVTVSLEVKNTGDVIGAEVVQLYIHDKYASIVRPIKELKGFDKVFLKPGETKTVSFTIKPKDLSFWNIDMDFVVEPGEFEIMIGSSSEDIILRSILTLNK